MLAEAEPIIFDLTLARVLFGLLLGGAATVIGVFSLYVVSCAIWGNRWFKRPKSE